GLHRQVTRDENHGAVLADGARERERESGRKRRQHGRQDHSAKYRPASPAERLGGFLEAHVDLLERRLHRADHEWHADQRKRDHDTEPRVCDLDAERPEPSADPTLRPEYGRERDARHGSRERERQIDYRVDDTPARESV